jgi:hypothetical protein
LVRSFRDVVNIGCWFVIQSHQWKLHVSSRCLLPIDWLIDANSVSTISDLSLWLRRFVYYQNCVCGIIPDVMVLSAEYHHLIHDVVLAAIWRCTSGAGTAHPFWTSEFNPGFEWGTCYSIFSCTCMFCRSLFVMLYFFIWPLCCSSIYEFLFSLLYRKHLELTCNFYWWDCITNQQPTLTTSRNDLTNNQPQYNTIRT